MARSMPVPAWVTENKVSVPARKKGVAQVSRYKLTAKRANEINWQIVLHAEDRAWAYPGTYTGLSIEKLMVMSDEAKEIQDHLPFIAKARGRVLLTGLGIGMCLQALLRKPEVEHVTVVELSADVLALVGPHYLEMFGCDRLSLVNANAYTWKPPAGTRFDYAWHDVWPLATGAFWPDHLRLVAHYDPFVWLQMTWRGPWMMRAWHAERGDDER